MNCRVRISNALLKVSNIIISGNVTTLIEFTVEFNVAYVFVEQLSYI